MRYSAFMQQEREIYVFAVQIQSTGSKCGWHGMIRSRAVRDLDLVSKNLDFETRRLEMKWSISISARFRDEGFPPSRSRLDFKNPRLAQP